MPPAAQTQRTQRKRPGDLTGVRGQQLAAQAKADKEEAARQITVAQEDQRVERLATEVDYTTKHPAVVKTPVAGPDGEVSIEAVEVEIPTRRIRVNYPIEDMTYGREVISPGEIDERGAYVKPPVLGGLRSYSFEEGRWYTVDADLAEHLAFLGYIYE